MLAADLWWRVRQPGQGRPGQCSIIADACSRGDDSLECHQGLHEECPHVPQGERVHFIDSALLPGPPAHAKPLDHWLDWDVDDGGGAVYCCPLWRMEEDPEALGWVEESELCRDVPFGSMKDVDQMDARRAAAHLELLRLRGAIQAQQNAAEIDRMNTKYGRP